MRAQKSSELGRGRMQGARQHKDAMRETEADLNCHRQSKPVKDRLPGGRMVCLPVLFLSFRRVPSEREWKGLTRSISTASLKGVDNNVVNGISLHAQAHPLFFRNYLFSSPALEPVAAGPDLPPPASSGSTGLPKHSALWPYPCPSGHRNEQDRREPRCALS